MCTFQIIFALLSSVAYSIILTTNGSTFQGPDWFITSCPKASITNILNTVPYQYIEILDKNSGLMKLGFNFTAGETKNVKN